MNFEPQKIDGLVLIHPELFRDERGVFRRHFCAKEFEAAGFPFPVVQANLSENLKRLTLRGFHYQKAPSEEGKIVTCLSGAIFNVCIDLRSDSKTYLSWQGIELDSESRSSIMIPAGCANAFMTLQNNTVIHYYMSDYYNPDTYSGFRYNDPFFSVEWPHQPLIVSEKDTSFPYFRE